jgi:hypothetical protein
VITVFTRVTTLLSSENVNDSHKVFISEVISFMYIVKGKGHKIEPVRNQCLTVPQFVKKFCVAFDNFISSFVCVSVN